MPRFTEGDQVRVDIPDETDPDHDAYHGVHGTVKVVFEDDADSLTDDTLDSKIYRVELEPGGEVDLRWRDLRPR